jgi:outer membrane protein assembly factor BamB
MQHTRWYHSSIVIVVAAILIPPLSLILLLTKPNLERPAKVLGSIATIAVACVYLVLFLFLGSGLLVRDPGTEAHYDELERHRAEQRTASNNLPGSQTENTAPATPQPADSSTNMPGAPTSASTSPSTTPANYWTDFRGPGRDGDYGEMRIKTDWPAEGLRPVWRQPVGGGYASFVVADGLAYTVEQRRQQEAVAAYEVNTGRETWVHSWDAEFRESNGDGPRATPTWDEGRVYALGAQGDLRVLDGKTGKAVWSKNILSDNGAQNLSWGMAATPLVVDDKVIVLPGGKSGKSVVAYNKSNGRPVWKVLDDEQAYTSPMLVTLAGRRQILVVSAKRVMGLNPDDGSLLWDHAWVTDFGVNSAQPIVLGENRLFISAGYGHGASVLEIAPNDSRFSARTVWANNMMKNKFNSSVLHQGHIYGLDEGIMACVDAGTGQRKWKGGRYGYGQLILAGEHIVLLSDSGELALVKATPEQHVEVARFSAIEGKTWNHPAISNGRLLVRNQTEMACFDVR